MECERCGKKECHVEKNRGQGVVRNRQKWYGCRGKREEKAVWPREAKTQQSSTRSGEPKNTAKKEVKERDVRRIFKILREVWLNIEIEKVDTHESVTVKVLLDSGATGMFIDRGMAKRHGFKMIKLERPLKVKNVDRTENSRGNITH